MSKVAYDSGVMYTEAERLYAQAKTIVVSYTAAGALLGAAAGYFAAEGEIGAVALTLAVVLGAIGFVIGRAASFRLRLQAQTVLCQVRIEENTRPK